MGSWLMDKLVKKMPAREYASHLFKIPVMHVLITYFNDMGYSLCDRFISMLEPLTNMTDCKPCYTGIEKYC